MNDEKGDAENEVDAKKDPEVIDDIPVEVKEIQENKEIEEKEESKVAEEAPEPKVGDICDNGQRPEGKEEVNVEMK